MTNRRLDPATFQALQALIGRDRLVVSDELAAAIAKRRTEIARPALALAEHFAVDDAGAVEAGSALTAGDLVQIARALDVDLVWFIENEPSFVERIDALNALDTPDIGIDAHEGLALLRAFADIKDPVARQKVLDLALHFAKGGDDRTL